MIYLFLFINLLTRVRNTVRDWHKARAFPQKSYRWLWKILRWKYYVEIINFFKISHYFYYVFWITYIWITYIFWITYFLIPYFGLPMHFRSPVFGLSLLGLPIFIIYSLLGLPVFFGYLYFWITCIWITRIWITYIFGLTIFGLPIFFLLYLDYSFWITFSFGREFH